MNVALIVVSYNSAERLPDFFRALPDALVGVNSYEIVVVDNASTDGSVEMARSLSPPAIVVVLDQNVGYAGGINAGIRAAKPGSHILVLNDDIRLHPGSVGRLVETLADSRVGIAVPRLEDGEGRLLKSLRREPTVGRALGEALLGGGLAGRWALTGEVIERPELYDREREADWASGCAWLISAECSTRVGAWDESFFLYAEDIDYALRSRDAGFELRFVPTAEATHLVGPSHRDPRLWAMSVWNRYRVFRRRHGRGRSALFWAALTLGEFLRTIAGREVHRAGLAALVSPSRRPLEVR